MEQDKKANKITIHYTPASGIIEPLTIESTEKSGYAVHGQPGEIPLGYRLYYGSKTFLVPAVNVKLIEMDLIKSS